MKQAIHWSMEQPCRQGLRISGGLGVPPTRGCSNVWARFEVQGPSWPWRVLTLILQDKMASRSSRQGLDGACPGEGGLEV